MWVFFNLESDAYLLISSVSQASNFCKKLDAGTLDAVDLGTDCAGTRSCHYYEKINGPMTYRSEQC